MGCTDLLDLFRLLSVHSIPVGPANQSGRHAAGPAGGRHEPAVAATWADGRQRDHL